MDVRGQPADALQGVATDRELHQGRSTGFFRQLLSNRSAVVGGTVVALIFVTAIAAPILAPSDPLDQELSNRLKPPTRAHLLGTDKFGRDVLSRVIWGARVSLLIGIVAVLVGSVVGSLLGLLAGYTRGHVDNLIMRVMDVMLSLPTVVLALAMVAVLQQSLLNLMIAVGIVLIPSFARLMRSAVLSEVEKDYVVAARAMGAKHPRIIFQHITPNAISSVVVLATLRIATAILIEASLSFLGLGVEFDRPTWGNMINEGRAYIQLAPWVSIFPGVAIMITVLGFSLLGDGLREELDPRLSS